MAFTTDRPEDEAPTTTLPRAGAASHAREGGAPAIGTAAGDRCAACGSLMAADQHYCLECGERRGPARFSPQPATAVTTTTTRKELRRTPRLSGSTTLIAGVGTLLLAMGIGVLIGRTGANPSTPGNSKVQVVNVGGGNGASSATTSAPAGTTGGGSGGSGGSHKGHGKAQAAAAKAPPASTKNLSAANATRTVKNLPPPTVTVGQKGQGPGYTHGHFTGNFFGP